MKSLKFILGIFIPIIAIAMIKLEAQIGPVFVGWIILIIWSIYAISSFGKINPIEEGVLLFFGKPVKKLSHGPYWAPLGIFQVKKFPSVEITERLPLAKIKFSNPKDKSSKELKGDPLNEAMILEVATVVMWRIKNPFVFYTKWGSIKNCRERFTTKATTIATDEFSEITPAAAVRNLKKTSGGLKDALDEIDHGQGFDIIDAFFEKLLYPEELEKAITNVAKAKEDALATIITAEAVKTKRKKEADGDAYYKRKDLMAEADGKAAIKDKTYEAEAKGLRKLAEMASKPNGEKVMIIKALETAASEADYSIITGGDSLLGATGAIKEALSKLGGGKK